jgi:hypothetical protein
MSQSFHKHPYGSNVIELLPMENSTFDTFAAGTSDHTKSRHFESTTRSSSTGSKGLRKVQTRLIGWKSGAINFSLIAFIIFLVNLVVTSYGIRSHPSNRGVLFEGDCDLVKNYNTGIHVLINIISTVLMSGSNYSMQFSSAPNRREVHQAHARGKWLDIGILSLRNLKVISLRRKVL